jgi:hypothetical protein
MRGTQRAEPAYSVWVVWTGGSNETWVFYNPGAFQDATEHYRDLKGKGGFQSLALNRFDVFKWVVIEQTEPERKDQDRGTP